MKLKLIFISAALFLFYGCGSPNGNSDSEEIDETINSSSSILLEISSSSGEETPISNLSSEGNNSSSSIEISSSSVVEVSSSSSIEISSSSVVEISSSSSIEVSSSSSIIIGAWWKPVNNTTWNWQLTGTIDQTIDADAYDLDMEETSAATITSLHNKGIKVICYFSGGTWESYRDDAANISEASLGKVMDDWSEERWWDVRTDEVRAVVSSRLDVAASKGCDAVEPDNMDVFDNFEDSQLDISAAEQLDFNKWVAEQAHARGLSVALKNDVGQLKDLEPYFDFAINEECFAYNECEDYSVFTENDKPVLNAEYENADTEAERTALCAEAAKLNLQTLVLPLDLDGSFRYTCY